MTNEEQTPESQDQGKRPPTIEELVAMPLGEAEARVQLANLDIQMAQCQQRKAEIDREIADITAIRTIVLRRVLNPQPEEPVSDGSGN